MQVPSGLLDLVPMTLYRISSSVTPGTPEIPTNLSRSAEAALSSPAALLSSDVVPVAPSSSSSPEFPHAASPRLRTQSATTKRRARPERPWERDTCAVIAFPLCRPEGPPTNVTQQLEVRYDNSAGRQPVAPRVGAAAGGYRIAPDSFMAAMASQSNPASSSTCSVCSPCSGARLTSTGHSSNCAGLATSWTCWPLGASIAGR